MILMVWEKKQIVQFGKFYKLISGEKNSVQKREDEKHIYYLKIIKQHICNKVLNTWDRANIMKTISTWPRTSLPSFHQMAFQDRTSQCDPEGPFGET